MKPFRFALAVLACSAVVTLAGADTLITTNHHSDAVPMAKRPAKDSVEKVWIAKDKLRNDAEDGGVLIRIDQKKMFVLDSESKKASSVDLPLDLGKLIPPDMAAMVQSMKMTAKLSPTDETKKIRDWNTKRYNLELSSPQGMKIEMVLWVTKDLKLDYSLYKQLVTNMASLNPMMAEMAKEMSKIDGVSVLTETTMTMMGASIKNREEIVSIEEKPAPAGTYDVPAGFAVEPLDLAKEMMGGGGRGR